MCSYRKVQCHSSTTKIRPISWVIPTHSPFYTCPDLGSKKNFNYRRIPFFKDSDLYIISLGGREQREAKGRNRTKRFIKYALRKESPCVISVGKKQNKNKPRTQSTWVTNPSKGLFPWQTVTRKGKDCLAPIQFKLANKDSNQRFLLRRPDAARYQEQE